MERYAAHEIQRLDDTVDSPLLRTDSHAHEATRIDLNYPLLHTYSNSYEVKRIDLIRTALAYLAVQPETKRPQASLPPLPTSVGTSVEARGNALVQALPGSSRASFSSARRPWLSRSLARKQYPALTHYLERLEAAYGSDTALHPIEDIDHMETIIKGLNLADPMLN
ncbi:hypothetical protein Q3O93_25100, partial [Ralstonia pseudosolanacearum]|nr:hypothetical protein [Ralstonia pseudosolanacearum]MDO3535169.1 hypothetical protein [Ralstonia pseudosolanacearum]